VLFFNAKKILTASNGSTREFLKIFRFITFKPKHAFSEKDKTYKYRSQNWKGDSFLINPEMLFTNRALYKDREIVEYILLASHRNYGEYKLLGKTTLDLLAYRGKEDIIKNNRLLQIKNGEIYFLFEEAQKGDKKNGISI